MGPHFAKYMHYPMHGRPGFFRAALGARKKSAGRNTSGALFASGFRPQQSVMWGTQAHRSRVPPWCGQGRPKAHDSAPGAARGGPLLKSPRPHPRGRGASGKLRPTGRVFCHDPARARAMAAPGACRRGGPQTRAAPLRFSSPWLPGRENPPPGSTNGSAFPGAGP